MNGIIRKAEEKDIPVIAEYNCKLAWETEELKLDPETVTKGVAAVIRDSGKGIFFLYEVDNRIAGQLMITKEWSDWRNGEFWWIQSVYVHKEFRRRGIFKYLYEHAHKIAVENDDICGIRLYVEKENINAQKTYKSLGMEETNYRLYEFSKRKL